MRFMRFMRFAGLARLGLGRRPQHGLAGRGVAQLLHELLGHGGLGMVDRAFAEFDVEPIREMLEQPDPLGVDPRGGQVDHFGHPRLAIGAGGLDVREVDIGPDVDPQREGDAVHHLTDTETACAGTEVEHADADDHARLAGDARIGHRLVPVALDVLHIQRYGVRVVLAHRLDAFVHAVGLLMTVVLVLRPLRGLIGVPEFPGIVVGGALGMWGRRPRGRNLRCWLSFDETHITSTSACQVSQRLVPHPCRARTEMGRNRALDGGACHRRGVRPTTTTRGDMAGYGPYGQVDTNVD